MTATIAPYVTETDRVLIHGNLGALVAGKHGPSLSGLKWLPDDDQVIVDFAAFSDDYEIVNDDGLNLASETYDEWLETVRVIRRRSDGKYFGFTMHKDLAGHTGDECDPNGWQHGFDPEWTEDQAAWEASQVWVFTPVYPFVIHGYRHASK